MPSTFPRLREAAGRRRDAARFEEEEQLLLLLSKSREAAAAWPSSNEGKDSTFSALWVVRYAHGVAVMSLVVLHVD